MKFTNDGLSLWYGTPDTPAPPADGASRNSLSLTLAAKPPDATNSVVVDYRVDGGITRRLPAYELRVDYTSQVQYFRAVFPPFLDGASVEYRPLLTSLGRQVPAPETAHRFPSRFRLSDPPPLAPASSAQQSTSPMPSGQCFVPQLEYVASIRTAISNRSDLIGETPDGLRINYYLAGGTVSGPRLNGTDLPRGGDLLRIRRDGVALVDVHCVYQLNDGAVIGADITGYIDLGPDGYRCAIAGDFPATATIQISPNLIAADGGYQWVNRCQFMGVGQVNVATATVSYDLFALRTDVVSGR